MSSIPEKDWKYLRKLQPELLNKLCAKINMISIELLQSDKTDHEKFLGVYDLINDRNTDVADCFNDWRRSNIWIKLVTIDRNGLLTDEQVNGLSEETQDLLQRSRDMWDPDAQ
jgi:hypothetical protein